MNTVSRIVAVDVSLASTGLATHHYLSGPLVVGHVATKGKRDDTWVERRARIRGIVAEVRDWLVPGILTVIEGPAGAAPGGSTWDRAGLWWSIADAAMACGPVAVVGPTTRAKWATGDGRADKAAVAAAMKGRLPDVTFANSDEADAAALAFMAAQYLGWRPVKTKVEQQQLTVVRWPAELNGGVFDAARVAG